MTAVQTSYRRTFGNFEQPTVEEIRENAKTFLLAFAWAIEETCRAEEYEGLIKWVLIQLSPTTVCIEIQFIPTLVDGEEPDICPMYRMFVSKRYFSNNMVRLTDVATGKTVPMAADPQWVMACIANV